MAPETDNYDEVKIIENCQVAPPQGSLPSTTLPFTFFDIQWFLCHPVKRIFFYDFPYPTNHFLQSSLPPLKHSLSLALQHFFPFASKLIWPPPPHEPFMRYHQGSDSVAFTVAESKADFNLLVSDSPQNARDWHPFVPSLPPQDTLENGTRVIPLMAIQVTMIPNSGFAICLTFNHLVADGKSLHHFIKFWATLCKEIVTKGGNNLGSFLEGSNSNLTLPSHDRNMIKDPKGLKQVFLEELKKSYFESLEFRGLVEDVSTNKARGTLVVTRDQVDKLKKWVSLKYSDTYGDNSESLQHISTFVVTSSLVWVSIIESEEQCNNNNKYDENCHLVFLADCRGHVEFCVPQNYFGNCLDSGFVTFKRGDILGENGIVRVASAIESEIKELKREAYRDGENVMERYKELATSGERLIIVAGSPRLGVYETDFGWGKPRKSEAAHLESSGSISLSDSKNKEGAIEVGFSLEWPRMNLFINIFEQHIKSVHQTLSMMTNLN
ncbi:coumaroyl-CoA:anthocyanidin 3-O-glucoside-6''-O-coumaroyltransferase 1-like [Arachis stenosperma]|uniref:coumaroyl-CoA:anthocyanidin 3-O-glucoside-6''-O-coumaroyltransferase 1-like n=1 Tax=Arachis stenosperma TaxID=217475 RepID=UPI0025AC3FB1|nr:coumaroyl-CoA:anthocyanidin 3-O-glucoside-6''-O-coumaroyltransferase 1-like [Arachis stenosperma]